VVRSERRRIDAARLRGHFERELRAAATYRALVDQVEGQLREVLLRLARGEEQHARYWQRMLRAAFPEPDEPFDAALSQHSRCLRTRLLAWLLRHGGLLLLLALLERGESAEIERYGGEP